MSFTNLNVDLPNIKHVENPSTLSYFLTFPTSMTESGDGLMAEYGQIRSETNYVHLKRGTLVSVVIEQKLTLALV